MKRCWILLILCALLPVAGEARSRCDKEACKDVKEEIRSIEAKMRSGYTRAQGERYEAKLRKLKTRRSRLCR